MKTKYLLTPGPVELPANILNAGAKPMISHRCDDFSNLLAAIGAKLGALFKSCGPVVILPASGTGALEALAVNFLDRNSSFMSVSCGVFGDRFREIALRTGAAGIFVDVPAGEGVSPELVMDALTRAGRHCDALLLTHNETSTGVVNPIKEIAAAIPENIRPLILVDGVSSVGAMECFPQEWGIDGIATASQKGLLTPPGLAFAWLSECAWKYLQNRPCPSYYFDLKLHRLELESKSPGNPYTPPVSLYYALDVALDFILKEKGAETWFAEKKRYAKALAAGLEAMGFELLAKEEKFRSAGVTAIRSPQNNTEEIRNNLRQAGIEIAGGQGYMKNEVLRIAHYHDCGVAELSMILGALRAASGPAGSDDREFLNRALITWENFLP